ncbi:rod-binding protein [Roseinatronobacter sp.]|uniref:rod-binding protein n=1 Tax=Roseinatronobacter sp. TaxID=1945755 RepID=UPI003F70F577
MSGIMPLQAPVPVHENQISARNAQQRAGAVEFEALVLAEFLRAAGVGKPTSGFESGVGEDQFASFLVDAQARAIAANGGIGLAEMVLRAAVAPGGKADV